MFAEQHLDGLNLEYIRIKVPHGQMWDEESGRGGGQKVGTSYGYSRCQTKKGGWTRMERDREFSVRYLKDDQ